MNLDMNMFLKLDHERFGKIFAGMFLASIFWCMILFPKILKTAVVMQSKLKPGAKNREQVYLNIPFELDFRVHLFNITNPEGLLRGEKPSYQEVGPYRFGEYKKKYDEVDNDEEDSLEFDLKNTFFYKPDLTAPLTGQEVVTVPNLILMAALIKTKIESEAMIEVVVKGLSKVFDNPPTPFFTVKVWDLLYGGIPIDCGHHEFEAQAVCGALETELASQIERLNETHLSFALFKGANGTSVGRFKVKRGMRDIKELNRMMEYNGETELDNWEEDQCNELRGTDGLMFAPFQSKTRPVVAFTFALCRSLELTYLRKTRYKGLRLHQFTTTFPDLRNHPEKQCYCVDPPDGCPPEGMIDLAPCLGGPLLASKPHFLEVDKSVLEMVNGLAPDPEKHQLTADFDLFAGNPLHAEQRVQISLHAIPLEEFEPMANIQEHYMPLFWLEEGISVKGEILFSVRLLHIVKTFNSLMKWSFLLIGMSGGAACAYMLVNQSSQNEVKSVEPMSRDTSAGIVQTVSNHSTKLPPIVTAVPNYTSDDTNGNSFRTH